MPLLEQADLEAVAEAARKVSDELLQLIDEGYDIVALTASCALMLKFEWALILPEGSGDRAAVAGDASTSTNMSSTSPRRRACPRPERRSKALTVHLACHARAQNMGPKAAEMLRLIPETRSR